MQDINEYCNRILKVTKITLLSIYICSYIQDGWLHYKTAFLQDVI